MNVPAGRSLKIGDQAPGLDDLQAEVLQGLSKSRKTLPSKLFYDAYGSGLFDRITELEEYYLTRTELAIMERHIDEMVAYLGDNSILVEYGSGSSIKTRLLLDHARHLAGYVPIDISCDYLQESAAGLQSMYPALRIRPICADYTKPFSLPLERMNPSRVVVYFPGSTIGNFTPDGAARFLRRVADVCGPGGGLLIGADLQKDRQVLEAAYNDASGVTAAFNLNMLRRINGEMGATFDLGRFRHEAVYDPETGRIEMHLVSETDQEVRVNGTTIPFRRGETILTEYSHKYTLPQFAGLARSAGFTVQHVWLDDRKYFSVQYLVVGENDLRAVQETV